MGLLYQFPLKVNESDHIFVEENPKGSPHGKAKKLSIKTYGLPLMFWGYYFVAIIVITLMTVGIIPTMKKLLISPVLMDNVLASIILATMVLVPIISLGFFFYQKKITKQGHQLTVIQKVFGLTFSKKELHLNSQDPLQIHHHLDSPNMARLHNTNKHLGYQNRGYFELWVQTNENKKVLIDRHSQKKAVKDLIELLNSF